MTGAITLPEIVRACDLKILGCLQGESREHFWQAHCPANLQELHALGFDNYLVARIPAVDALRLHLFFFERIFGAELGSPDGQVGDFFHTWCRPLIGDAQEIGSMKIDLDASPVWQAYEKAVRDYLSATPADQRLPVAFPGLSPLDMACNLCGPEPFFLMLYEEPQAAGRLLDMIVTLFVEAHRRVGGLGARVVSPFGFPGVYCGDLQMPALSPAHVAGIMLPRYQRIATECGGLMLALLCADPDVLRSALGMEGLIGCSFDKRLPLPEIERHLGRKLFLISHYCYDDALDKPTLRNGTWWNPIVQAYSRELPEVYRELSDEHNLLISIERPSLAEALALRRGLSMNTSGASPVGDLDHLTASPCL